MSDVLERDAQSVDLIVIGSGAAGLCAALTAAVDGASVLVLEKSDKIGGTTAVSGGLLWVPMNPKGAQIGFRDTRQAAVDYILGTAGELTDPQLVDTFVDSAAETLSFLEAHSGLVALNTPYPDTFAEEKGGVKLGRHVEAAPFDTKRLGKWRKHLRSSAMPSPLTSGEMLAANFLSDFRGFVRRNLLKMMWRLVRGYRAAGMGLVGSILKGCIDSGVRFSLEARVIELLQDKTGRVIGVVAQTPRGDQHFAGSCGIVLATGGFEWDAEMAERFLPVPLSFFPSPPGLAAGDNIRLASQVGAQLDKLGMYWNWPTGELPGLLYEGAPIGVLMFAERMLPHSLWVNRAGRRFCNESDHNVAFAFEKRDGSGVLLNQPAWAILDGQYRAKYPVLFKVMPGSSDPPWLVKADTLRALAERLGIDAEQLESTVNRFNMQARAGRDSDFGRGERFYERTLGDTRAAHPNLGSIEKPPFYAIEVHASAVGTRGGPRTNASGQVLAGDGGAIPGLFAAGNAAAGFCGPKTIAGITIMPAMTFGRIAARRALQSAGRAQLAAAGAGSIHDASARSLGDDRLHG